MLKNRLNDISKSEYYNKPIKVRCIISGKSAAPYYIPKKIFVECRGGESCEEFCNLKKGKMLDIKPKDENVLLFVDLNTRYIPKLVSQMFGIRCKSFTCRVEEVQSLERIFISQPTGKERSKWSTARQAFHFGHGLDINTVYNMSGYTTVDPINQTVTHVFTQAVKAKSDIESFVLIPTIHTRLSQFNIREQTKEAYFEHLDKLYDSYAHNLTKIHQRFLLHLAVDMVFHSVLDFNFDGEYVKKGWVDANIIGDSSIGKGYVAERLTNFFGVGEVVSAETCSYAGLVAGLQKFNQHWVITWGKIPMNDRGLVVIDEGSNIIDEWTQLTRIRSEGVVEFTKIQAQVANARTRLLTLSNPPPGRTISNYSYGIQAICDLVPSAEDIRRFDYAYVASNNEVPVAEINSSHSNINTMYSRQAERDLVMWMWSRTTDEIDFTDEAVALIYKRAIRLSEIYDSTIPLIQAENVRIKLAKLSVCFAGRFYSNRNKGNVLLVDKVHVDCATLFFHLIYKTEASGYYVYSKLKKESQELFERRSIKNIEAYMQSFQNKDEVYRCLLQNNTITVNDIVEHLSQRKEIAVEIISKLLQNNCVVRKYSYYVKTPQFTAWLKDKIITDQMKGL